jgi:hypothetical protein
MTDFYRTTSTSDLHHGQKKGRFDLILVYLLHFSTLSLSS